MCARCGQQSRHQRRHDYGVTTIVFIPAVSFGHEYSEVCGNCGWPTPLFGAPPGTKGIPFMHRFGVLVILAAVVLSGGGFIGFKTIQNKWRQDEASEKERELGVARAEQERTASQDGLAKANALKTLPQDVDEVIRLRKQVYEEDRRCTDDLLRSAPTPAIRAKVTDKVPTDVAKLLDAPVVILNFWAHSRENHRLGRILCSTTLSTELYSLRFPSDIQYGGAGRLADRMSEVQTKLALAKTRPEVPPVLGILDGRCDAKKCTATQIYFTTQKREIIAVAKVSGERNGETAEVALRRLAPALAAKVDTWP